MKTDEAISFRWRDLANRFSDGSLMYVRFHQKLIFGYGAHLQVRSLAEEIRQYTISGPLA